MKKLVPLSLAAIAATLAFTNTAFGADGHTEVVGIELPAPPIGPSTIVRTEVDWGAVTETDIRAAVLKFMSLPTRIVERYEVVPNPALDDLDPRHDELVGIGVHSPVLGLAVISATSTIHGDTIAMD